MATGAPPLSSQVVLQPSGGGSGGGSGPVGSVVLEPSYPEPEGEEGSYAAQAMELQIQKYLRAWAPASYFSGKMILLVQALYGTQRRDLSYTKWGYLVYPMITSGSVAILNHQHGACTGLYTSKEGREYWLVRLGMDGTAKVKRWVTEDCELAERFDELAEATKVKAEAYVLATGIPAGDWVTIAEDIPQLDPNEVGTPFGYTWHFNKKGDEISVVSARTIGLGLNSEYITALLTLKIEENDVSREDFDSYEEYVQAKFQLTGETVEETEPFNFLGISKILAPDFLFGGHYWANESQGPMSDIDDAPVYCFYDESDVLQVAKYSYSSTPDDQDQVVTGTFCGTVDQCFIDRDTENGGSESGFGTPATLEAVRSGYSESVYVQNSIVGGGGTPDGASYGCGDHWWPTLGYQSACNTAPTFTDWQDLDCTGCSDGTGVEWVKKYTANVEHITSEFTGFYGASNFLVLPFKLADGMIVHNLDLYYTMNISSSKHTWTRMVVQGDHTCFSWATCYMYCCNYADICPVGGSPCSCDPECLPPSYIGCCRWTDYEHFDKCATYEPTRTGPIPGAHFEVKPGCLICLTVGSVGNCIEIECGFAERTKTPCKSGNCDEPGMVVEGIWSPHSEYWGTHTSENTNGEAIKYKYQAWLWSRHHNEELDYQEGILNNDYFRRDCADPFPTPQEEPPDYYQLLHDLHINDMMAIDKLNDSMSRSILLGESYNFGNLMGWYNEDREPKMYDGYDGYMDGAFVGWD